MSVKQVGVRLIKQLRAKNRKDSSLDNYESYLCVHLFCISARRRLGPHGRDVEDFMEVCVGE
jgi:hypothetical protein